VFLNKRWILSGEFKYVGCIGKLKLCRTNWCVFCMGVRV